MVATLRELRPDASEHLAQAAPAILAAGPADPEPAPCSAVCAVTQHDPQHGTARPPRAHESNPLHSSSAGSYGLDCTARTA